MKSNDKVYALKVLNKWEMLKRQQVWCWCSLSLSLSLSPAPSLPHSLSLSTSLKLDTHTHTYSTYFICLKFHVGFNHTLDHIHTHCNLQKTKTNTPTLCSKSAIASTRLPWKPWLSGHAVCDSVCVQCCAWLFVIVSYKDTWMMVHSYHLPFPLSFLAPLIICLDNSVLIVQW